MELLVSTIKKEAETLKKNGVRLYVIGDMESLPDYCVQELHEAMEITAGNDRLNLILALSYSSKWEITHATKK